MRRVFALSAVLVVSVASSQTQALTLTGTPASAGSIRVIATPTPPDIYPNTYLNWLQGRRRETAVNAITRWLIHPSHPSSLTWDVVDRAQRRAIVVEVTRVTATASGAPFFIRHGLPTNRHWEVTTLVHLPGGQIKTFTGSEVLISAAAIDAADQSLTWVVQR